MRLSVVAVPAALAIIAAGATSSRAPRDVRRIQGHFDSVLVELSHRNISALSAAQRAERVRLVAELRRYRDAGVFPRNYDFAAPTPYFIDRKTGTLCAVANLLASSGRRDIVDRVAAANNNVWVAQLAGDTAFTRWLDASGLTLDEAARIQVPYVGPLPDEKPLTSAQRARNTAYLITAPVAIGGAAITAFLNARSNADGHRTGVSKAGIATGLGSIAAGTLLMAKRDLPSGYFAAGAASTVLGGASVMLSTRSMQRHNASLAPVVTMGSRPAAGLSLSIDY